MAASFKIGQTVKVAAVVPQGPVQQLTVDQEGNITYLVEWTNAEGVTHQSWYKEDQLIAG
jgi:uncharacterized protein YodC (DUF2158 family)